MSAGGGMPAFTPARCMRATKPLVRPSVRGINGPSMSSSGFPIGACYLAFWAAVGLYLPFLSVYLSSVGLSDAESVQVQAIIPVMSLIAPPLLGMLADARRARIWLLRGCAAGSTAAFVALGAAGGRMVLLAAALAAFAVARAPLMSLIDAIAHDHVRHHGGSYGRLRTWGSFGFLVAVLVSGALYDALSIRWLVWVTAAMFGLLVVAAWRVPGVAPTRDPGGFGDVARLVRNRALWLLLLAVAAAQAAATCYDSMLALHLRNLGYGKDFAGLVIAIGVAAEMLVLAGSARLLAGFRLERTIVVAYVIAALRWLVLASATSKLVLIVQAPLHAVSFALYWISATTLIREYAGPRASAAGQGLLAAAAAVGTIAGNLYGGPLFERGGGALLYLAAAAAAALAAVLAGLHAVAFARAGRAPVCVIAS